VLARASTIAFSEGWLVKPLMDSSAKSAMLSPASAAIKTAAPPLPAESWVWRHSGIETLSRKAPNSFLAA
jgi:hypothetical protein